MTFYLSFLSNNSGAIQYDDLIGLASEADLKSVEDIQSTISPDSGCNVQFSSGTTGKPKAALLSHFSMINNGYDVGKDFMFALLIFKGHKLPSF